MKIDTIRLNKYLSDIVRSAQDLKMIVEVVSKPPLGLNPCVKL